MRRYIYEADPKAGDTIWKISEKPLLVLNISFRKKKKEKKHKKGKDKEKEKEKDDDDDKEESEDENEMIYFSPSYNKIFQGLIKPLTLLMEFTNDIHKLEGDLVPFLYLDKEIAYNVNT